MAWTIETAKQCRGLDRVIVSTDSSEYAKIARDHGAETPFLRPAEISKDVDSGLVVKHVLDWLLVNESYMCDAVCLLQPTSPFRSIEDIDECLKLYATNIYDTVLTVKRITEHPAWMYRMLGNYLDSFMGFPSRIMSGLIAQELPILWIPSGAIYVTSSTLAMRGQIYGERLGGVQVPMERSIDIETEEDFNRCELMLEMRRKQSLNTNAKTAVKSSTDLLQPSMGNESSAHINVTREEKKKTRGLSKR